MKTTLQRIMIVLVILTLLLTMTACDDSSDNDTDTPSCPDATCLIARGIDNLGNGNGKLELTEIFATPTP